MNTKSICKWQISDFCKRGALVILGLAAIGGIPTWAADADNNGLSDEFDVFFGLESVTNAASLDSDADGLNNLAESLSWTDPLVADTDRDGFTDSTDSNPVSRAWVPWGEPLFMHTNEVIYTWPPWLVAAFKYGGDWQTNPFSWHVAADDTNVAALHIDLDRGLLTKDLAMQLGYVDHSNASVFVDLYDTNEVIIASNLFENLLSGSGLETNRIINIPLETYSSAVGISLRHGTGELTVCNALLYVDKDGDGLDAEQELQFGTSDSDVDSDLDGFADYEEVFRFGTDPASALSAPFGMMMGQVFYSGIQTGMLHVVAAADAGAWTSCWATAVSSPGDYSVYSPQRRTYFVKAYRDVNGNCARDYWEPCGSAVPLSLYLTTATTGGVAVAMSDPDSDADGMTDAVELALGLDPFTPDSFASLPFVELFESNTVRLGDVNGQNGWMTSSSNTVMVQTSVVWEGSQALTLHSSNTAASVCQYFAVSNAPVVWVDSHVQIKSSVEPTNTPSSSAMLFFDANGYLTVYDGLLASSNKWVAITNLPPCRATGEWARLTVKLDYNTQQWLVCLDGCLAAQGLGFATPVSQFSMLSMRGANGCLDAMSISTNEPPGLSLDSDHLPDDWEMSTFGNLEQADEGDPDHDGLINIQEYRLGLDPNCPDMDNDGIPDGWEVANGLNPTNAADAVYDADGDGLSSLAEYLNGTDILKPDSDNDGLTDSAEINIWHTNPMASDSDGDTLTDSEEIQLFGTNPMRVDSQTNGVADAVLLAEKDGIATAARGQWHIWSPWSEAGTTLCNPGNNANASYDFAVSQAGMCRVGLQLRNMENPPENFTFQVQVSMDGVYSGVVEVFVDTAMSGVGYLATPWLIPGEHRVTLQWMNTVTSAGRAAKIGIEKVRLYAINAPDANTNGVQDWMEAALEPGNDSDRDGITDKDEVMVYHTNPLLEDTDRDGLADGAELSRGTNPNLADTDGDGVTDGQEVDETLTDPLSSEFDGNITDVDVVQGVQTNHAVGTWLASGTEIVAGSMRGYVEYNVNSPTSDVYRIRINATHHFASSTCSPVVPIGESDLQVYVDGRYMGKKHLVAPDGLYSSVEVFTPWLSSGPHTVRVFWENVHSRLSLKIKDIRLQQLGGADSNGDGVKNWVAAMILGQSGLDAAPATSVVSPVCLEGAARFIDMMTITSGGTTGVVKNGILGRWYADVPLVSTGSTLIEVLYQGGVVARSSNVTWTALNLLSAQAMTIRKNDALKLTAFPVGVTNGTVEVIVEGATNALTTVAEPVTFTFSQGGTYTVTGIHDHEGTAQTNSITVTVVDGTFPSEQPACLLGSVRNWSCTSMPADVVLEADPNVELGWADQVATLRMNAINEDHYVVARLYPNGPILDSTRLDGFWVQGAVDSYIWVVEKYADSQLWQNTMVTKKVPASVSIQINMFIGGVTFEDMTVTRSLVAQDLSEIGEYTFRMIHPNSVTASTCHTINIYQGDEYLGEAYYGGNLIPQE